jgi:hypothetical protein
MFFKGLMKDRGIDITIKNNPDHVLAPDSWDMVLAIKFKKISNEKYKEYYLNLIKKRWETRKSEFIELAKKGAKEDIKLRCFCPMKDKFCHCYLAAAFMNKLIEKLKLNVIT